MLPVEFKINLLRPAVGDRFLAIGRVRTAGRQLTICTGEAWAFSGEETDGRQIALTQATIFNLPPR